MSIHYQLATLQKGDSSIADYYHCFTHLTHTFAAIEQPLPHHESLSFLLAGLGSNYDSLVTSVQTQLTSIALEDLYGHLLSYELWLSHNQLFVDLSSASAILCTKIPTPEEGVLAKIPTLSPQIRPQQISQLEKQGAWSLQLFKLF